MRIRRVGDRPARYFHRALPAILAGAFVVVTSPLYAQAPTPVSLGAGLRTSFAGTIPDEGDSTSAFLLNSARLYVNGGVTSKIKYMFNSEYNGGTNAVGVLDAVARIEASPTMNIWMGRFLPPSDRANLYGPYYSNQWGVYTDGIQNGHPAVFQGRDNGVVYWGDFGKAKLSGGLFDGESATGDTEMLVAARAQYDFWDKEGGYYLNGTYYGGKNLLSIGAAIQEQDGDTAFTFDFLLEKKGKSGGCFTIESEYANYSGLGGYDAAYTDSDGGYLLASYLFKKKDNAMGAFEILGKFAQANFSQGLAKSNKDYNQKTTEFNLNYVIKEFNARLMFFFRNTNFSQDSARQDSNQVGVGLQIQM